MLSLSVLPFRIGRPNEGASTDTCEITGQVAHVVDVWPSCVEQFGGRDTPPAQAHHFPQHEDGKHDPRVYASGPFWW